MTPLEHYHAKLGPVVETIKHRYCPLCNRVTLIVRQLDQQEGQATLTIEMCSACSFVHNVWIGD